MSRRNGFTMIELLVVIAIIGILAALIMAGVQSIRSKTMSNTTMTEIQEMALAMEKFKTKYGSYPPSVLRLTATEADLDSATKKALFRIWPGLTYSNMVSAFNVTGTKASPTVVKGDQCLVLFLGGRQTATSCIGFATRPSNPFETGGATSDVEHDPPFFNFKLNRLVKASGSTFFSYHDAYADSQAKPYASYAYFAPTAGAYSDTDCDTLVDLGASADSTYTQQYARPYKSNGAWINPQSFQIHSPGRDRLWGISTSYTATSPPTGIDRWNFDNFTNFSNGMLSAN